MTFLLHGKKFSKEVGEEIIKLPDGSLTTVYHYMKNSSLGLEEILTDTELEEIES